MLIKNIFTRSYYNYFESFIFRIPLVRPVYSGIKQLVSAFNPQDTVSFKEVVLVEFPRTGIYSLGFVTSELSPDFSPDTETINFKELISVGKMRG